MTRLTHRDRTADERWSYSLQRGSMDLRLHDLLTEHPLSDPSSFGCYRLHGTSPFSDIARRIECDVFEEFFGNAADVMVSEYGPYEEHSEFLLTVDRTSARAVGALRFITHSERGFKTLNDIATPPLSISAESIKTAHGIRDWTRCWDIATVAVIPELRGEAGGQLVSVALYGHTYALALRSGIEHFIAILDEHAYRQLTRTFAIPFAPILDTAPFSYLGSESSRATYVRLADIRAHMQRHLEGFDDKRRALLAPYFRRLLDGIGLPPVVDVP